MSMPADQVEIRTVAEALAWGAAWQLAYEREAEAHAEALRKLEIERMLSEDFAYWWQRQQD